MITGPLGGASQEVLWRSFGFQFTGEAKTFGNYSAWGGTRCACCFWRMSCHSAWRMNRGGPFLVRYPLPDRLRTVHVICTAVDFGASTQPLITAYKGRRSILQALRQEIFHDHLQRSNRKAKMRCRCLTIVLLTAAAKADVYRQCVTTLVVGGNGLNNRSRGLGFKAYMYALYK